MAAYPVAPKASAAGVAGAIAGAAVWVLQTYVFKGNVDPGLVSLIYAAAPGAVAFAAAYLAPHQHRPSADLERKLAQAVSSGAVTVIPSGPPPGAPGRLVIPGEEPPHGT